MILTQKLFACSLLSLLIFAGLEPGRGAHDATASANSEEPVFVEGDLDLLEVRILSSKIIERQAPLHFVEVEVTNKGSVPAEPLSFEFVVPGKSRRDPPRTARVRRVDAPWLGRAGRAVPPGGSLVFPLLAPVSKSESKKAEVEVARASFADYEPIDGSLIEFKIEGNQLVLHNHSQREVEAIFSAHITAPEHAKTLLHVRLAPQEQRESLLLLALNQDWRGFPFPTIKELELVDWSSIHPVDCTAEVEELRAAYDSRDTWPSIWPGMSGFFEFGTSSTKTHSCSGRFSIDRSGAVEVEIEIATSSNIEEECSTFILKACRGLLAPRFDTNFADYEFTLVEEGATPLLHLSPPAGAKSQVEEWLWVQDGRIGGIAHSANRLGAREVWESATTDEGWVLTGLEYFAENEELPAVEARWTFGELAAEPVPLRYEWRQREGPRRNKILKQIEFDSLRLGLDLEFDASPPSGPLADTLRQAWDASYHYPDEPRVLRGKLDIKHPETDWVWRGKGRVRGTYELREFVGTRWGSDTIDLDNKDWNGETYGLWQPIRDRMLLYMGRDFAGRPTFERAFAGASLEELKPGVIRVSDCRIQEVTIGRGLISSYRTTGVDGSVLHSLSYTKAYGEQLVKRVESGDEVIEYAFKEVADGWILPKKVTLKKIFGDDWGPETLSFSKLEISDE